MSKERIIIFVVIAFAAGFISGALTAVLKTAPATTQSTSQMAGGAVPTMPPPTAAGAIDPEKAKLIEQALLDKTRLQPDRAEAWVELGNFYFDTDQYQKAIAAYERSLQLKPDDPDVITDMGIMYRRTGNPRKAAELFTLALEKNPRHVQSLFNLGIVRRNELKDIPGAIEAWEQYLQIDPGNVHAVMVRAWLEELKKQ